MDNSPHFKYIYGPVYSWRLGVSLGIDPLATTGKACNLNCIYCQLGDTALLTNERAVYVPTAAVIDEIKAFPSKQPIDYYTFSGIGEPTLAKNLGEMIKALRALNKGKIAVITNSALMDQNDVQIDLALADFVLAKIDSCDQASFEKINRPAPGLYFDNIIAGIEKFRSLYKGKLALQLMFMETNKNLAQAMADLLRPLGADEIEINTPLRPCAVDPLSAGELLEIKKYFVGLPARTVYERERKIIDAVNPTETVKRHGRYLASAPAPNRRSRKK